MLPALEYTVPVGIPAILVGGAPGELNGFLDGRPEPLEPDHITADLPIPVDLHHVTELPVAARAVLVGIGAHRKLQSENHSPIGALVVTVVEIAHGPLQFWKKEGHGVGIVPDVGATPETAANASATPFPTPDRSILQPQDRWRLEN